MGVAPYKQYRRTSFFWISDVTDVRVGYGYAACREFPRAQRDAAACGEVASDAVECAQVPFGPHPTTRLNVLEN